MDQLLIHDNSSIGLTLEDIIRGIKTLYNIQHCSAPGLTDATKPLLIYTEYSANHTIMVPNKEGGYDFKYEITNEISLLAKYSGYVVGSNKFS